MKINFSQYALALSSVFLMSACSTPVAHDVPVADAETSMEATETRPVYSETAVTDPLNDPKSILADRSVYFDFDRYDVKEEYNPMLSAHARYLSSHKNRSILVQGNTDDRGGREYNLALGQKRAVAVTRSLAVFGVPESQMEAVSLGEEEPKASGHDEAARAENRRVDIVY